MKKRFLQLAIVPVLALFLLAGLFVLAPDSAVVEDAYAINEKVKVVRVASSQVVATDTNSTGHIWLSNSNGWGFTSADIFYTCAACTVTDTLDLKVQVSPDNSTWVAHSASPLGSQITAAGSGYEKFTVDGRYFRLQYDVATTAPLTIDIWAVLH
jgi:hypothetical protein